MLTNVGTNSHLDFLRLVGRYHELLYLVDVVGRGGDRLDLVWTGVGEGFDPLNLSRSGVCVPLHLPAWRKTCKGVMLPKIFSLVFSRPLLYM